MQKLIDIAKNTIKEDREFPFSVYSSSKEQHILNVPVVKPLLIFVLAGKKDLGLGREISCSAGSFVFLSNTSNVTMRNIPNDVEYFALLIEFEYSDFECLINRGSEKCSYIQGVIEPSLEYTVQQFLEWSARVPSQMWYLRRQEILQVLASLGHQHIASIMEPPSLTHRVHNIVAGHVGSELSAEALSRLLKMSESTLRRKLSQEGSSFQNIKDEAKLGHGLHLVQTTFVPIGLIAERCGYNSQSRFTDKFKQRFGTTPSALRKTRMRDLGE